ncbi:MAG: pirin family protein [Bacteroidetes bacterium]|nr:pirin family protein [Bacteroidota bacterium]
MSKQVPRRNFLGKLGAALAASVALPLISAKRILPTDDEPMTEPLIKNTKPLGFMWETIDPFLFCVHHEDFFPKGNAAMGPDPELFKGRHMGDDFIIKDGFRMYHGRTVPGFPGHPHRGFETITVVRKGLVDHADSLGAAGRYGEGDVQWMTAGKGVQHSEMFPLIHTDKENTMELFQIWLNLPAKDKMTEPHFKMLWADTIPHFTHTDNNNKKTEVEVIAGKLADKQAPAPPPNSWAADAANEVAVWNIKMEAGAVWTLPKAAKGLNRMLYFYQGENIQFGGTQIPKYTAVEVTSDQDIEIINPDHESRILMLQGKPIAEPVMQYGPFVMNTKEEIMKAFDDYHATQFGGWPWPRTDQVHDRSKGRFAKHADGRIEEKNG